MAITKKSKNSELSLEDIEYALFGREDDDNASALDEIPSTELDNDINGGPSMNTPEDLNDQDSQDDIQNSFHDGNTSDSQNGLEDDELFLNEDNGATATDTDILDTDETIDTATDINDSIGGDGTDVTTEVPAENTEIISDASQQEIPEGGADEVNGDISNPADAMESWLNNLSLEDLEIAVSDGENIDETITVGDDGSTTVQNNNANNNSGSDDSDDSSDDYSDDDAGDDDLSNMDKDSDDSDSDDSDDDSDDDSSDDDSDSDDSDDEGSKDDEGEENYDFFGDDYL